MYARPVVAYLVTLRLAGHELREGIRAIAREDEPWVNDMAIQNRPGRFERLYRGHFIGYEVDQADKTIRVLYVQST